MPLSEAGFSFVTPSEALFYLTDSEIEEQSTLDRTEVDRVDELGGDPWVWETSLVATASEMLLYLSRYSAVAIENCPLLKQINSYLSNWALEIYGIRDAQERRREWSIFTLELIRDGGPLFDAAGNRIVSLAESAGAMGKGYDSRTYTGNRANFAIIPTFQSAPLSWPLRDRLQRRR